MIGIDYKQLVEDVKTADFLLLDDNCVELEIVRIEGEADPLYRN